MFGDGSTELLGSGCWLLGCCSASYPLPTPSGSVMLRYLPLSYIICVQPISPESTKIHVLHLANRFAAICCRCSASGPLLLCFCMFCIWPADLLLFATVSAPGHTRPQLASPWPRPWSLAPGLRPRVADPWSQVQASRNPGPESEFWRSAAVAEPFNKKLGQASASALAPASSSFAISFVLPESPGKKLQAPQRGGGGGKSVCKSGTCAVASKAACLRMPGAEN